MLSLPSGDGDAGGNQDDKGSAAIAFENAVLEKPIVGTADRKEKRQRARIHPLAQPKELTPAQIDEHRLTHTP